jgi:hypothetical protein
VGPLQADGMSWLASDEAQYGFRLVLWMFFGPQRELEGLDGWTCPALASIAASWERRKPYI